MPRKLVSDELWSQIEPLLPKHKPTPKEAVHVYLTGQL